MATTSLVINSTTADGKKNAKSVSFVNADANSTVLTSFAQQLNGLTSNTYGDTTRVDKCNVDTEESGAPVETRTTGTITLSATSKPRSQLTGATAYFTFTTNSDGNPYVYFEYPLADYDAAKHNTFVTLHTYNGSFRVDVGKVNSSSDLATGTVKVVVPATDNYTAAEATFTITA